MNRRYRLLVWRIVSVVALLLSSGLVATPALAQVPTMFIRRCDTLRTGAMDAFLTLARQVARVS